MKTKVLFVCLGNICRSPLAEGIFRKKVHDRGLNNQFHIDSCGTAAYHIGDHPDRRSVSNARENGIDYDHLGRQLRVEDFEDFDYILPMDDSNMSDVLYRKPVDATAQVVKMRDFDPLGKGEDVPDPYYGGPQGFQNVFEILDRTTDELLDFLMEEK